MRLGEGKAGFKNERKKDRFAIALHEEASAPPKK